MPIESANNPLNNFNMGLFENLTKSYSLYSNGVKSFKVKMVGGVAAIGYTNLNNDYTKVDYLPVQPNISDGFSELINLDIRPEYTDYEQIFSYYEGTGGLDNKLYLSAIQSTNRLQLTIFNDGASGSDIAVTGDSLDVIKYILMEGSFIDPRNAKTVTLTTYDADFVQLKTASVVKDLTQDFKPIVSHMGSRIYQDHRAAINVYKHTSFHMGTFDYERHLWSENDPNTNKIISTTGIESILQDDSPIGATFPWWESDSYYHVHDVDENGDII